MIDTDKYKGHTPGPWELSPDDWVWAEHLFMQDNTTNFGNAMLIADAPLLLKAYKQLRKELKKANKELEDAKDVIQYALDMSSDDDSTRVFEDYLEVIE